MYTIGYFDDEESGYENYRVDLQYHGIDLVKPENIQSKDDLRKSILDLQMDCLIIDYNLNKLRQVELHDGNDIVRYINTEVPDFPCVVLTSYPEASRSEKTVVNSFILDRDELTNDTDGPVYKGVVQKIINSIEVFRTRLALNKTEYESILSKRKKEMLSIEEEDRFISLHKLLFAYDMVDEINPELLRKNMQTKMELVIERLNKILGE